MLHPLDVNTYTLSCKISQALFELVELSQVLQKFLLLIVESVLPYLDYMCMVKVFGFLTLCANTAGKLGT